MASNKVDVYVHTCECGLLLRCPGTGHPASDAAMRWLVACEDHLPKTLRALYVAHLATVQDNLDNGPLGIHGQPSESSMDESAEFYRCGSCGTQVPASAWATLCEECLAFEYRHSPPPPPTDNPRDKGSTHEDRRATYELRQGPGRTDGRETKTPTQDTKTCPPAAEAVAPPRWNTTPNVAPNGAPPMEGT